MYADVNGVQMYYEETGQGRPLVLLHGGFGGAHLFADQVRDLSATHRVLVPEQRGRGRTPDVEGPITYQLLADDIAAFIEGVAGGQADIVGFSDGGVVGLLLALQRPELLRKLVAVGANFNGEGLLNAAMWIDASPDDEAWAAPRARYAEVSPDGPAHFPVVFAKLQRMWRDGQPTLTPRDLSRIRIAVLVVVGDDDMIHLAHTTELYESLPLGQLAVIPGTSHGVFLEKPALLDRIMTDFLAEAEQPRTLLPVRRSRAAR